MKNVLSASRVYVVSATLLVGSCGIGASCQPPPKEVVKNLTITAEQLACVLMHSEVESSAVLAKVCEIAPELTEDILKAQKAQRMAAAHAASSSVSPSASSSASATKK